MRDRAALAVFGVALVVVPLYVLFTDDDAPIYDALRVFVLVQAGIVFCLMSYTMIWVVNRMWRARDIDRSVRPDTGAGAVVIGSLVKTVGILILLVRGAIGTLDRVGQIHLDWRTPSFQLALLFLFYAWALIDRRVYRTTKTPQELVGSIVIDDAVEQAKKIAEEAGLVESADAFRDMRSDRKNGD